MAQCSAKIGADNFQQLVSDVLSIVKRSLQIYYVTSNLLLRSSPRWTLARCSSSKNPALLAGAADVDTGVRLKLYAAVIRPFLLALYAVCVCAILKKPKKIANFKGHIAKAAGCLSLLLKYLLGSR